MQRSRHISRNVLSGLGLAALLAFPVAGCGSADAPDVTASTESTSIATPSPTSTPSPSAAATKRTKPLPACAKVWVAGDRLPGNYRGCQEKGKRLTAHTVCEIGLSLFTYHDQLYGMQTAKVLSAPSPGLRSDPDFRQVWRSCTG